MSRHLYSIYNDKRQIREIIRLLKSNANVDYNDTLTSDIALDLILSNQLDITNLPLLSPSKLILKYIQTTYTDWLAWRHCISFQDHHSSLQEHQSNYSKDSDYPIYVKTLIAKEKWVKHSSHLDKCITILKTVLTYFEIPFDQERFDSIKDGTVLVVFTEEL